MRRYRAVRIVAGLSDINTDSRQIGSVNLDPAHFLPSQVFAYGNGHEGPTAPRLTKYAPAIILRKIDNFFQPPQGFLHIERLLGD